MSNEVLVKQGTDIVWKPAGGDYALTLYTVANNDARQGQKGDLGATFAARYLVTAEISLGAAPTAGNLIELFWAASYDDSTFPGGAIGVDTGYKSNPVNEVDEWKKQLLLIGALAVTADADPVAQIQSFVFSPPTRYGAPVVVNKSGQAFAAFPAVPHQITLTPLIDEVQ